MTEKYTLEEVRAIQQCEHICSGNCRRNGCNCDCGEWHIDLETTPVMISEDDELERIVSDQREDVKEAVEKDLDRMESNFGNAAYY